MFLFLYHFLYIYIFIYVIVYVDFIYLWCACGLPYFGFVFSFFFFNITCVAQYLLLWDSAKCILLYLFIHSKANDKLFTFTMGQLLQFPSYSSVFIFHFYMMNDTLMIMIYIFCKLKLLIRIIRDDFSGTKKYLKNIFAFYNLHL